MKILIKFEYNSNFRATCSQNPCTRSWQICKSFLKRGKTIALKILTNVDGCRVRWRGGHITLLLRQEKSNEKHDIAVDWNNFRKVNFYYGVPAFHQRLPLGLVLTHRVVDTPEFTLCRIKKLRRYYIRTDKTRYALICITSSFFFFFF